MGEAAAGVSVATLFDGRLALRQFDQGHRAGTDTVLLAAAAGLRAGERFIDVGAGTGAVGLWLALQAPGASGVLLEADPDAAGLARDNAAVNGLAGQVRVAGLDLFDREGCRAAALDGSADLVITNPPFYRAGAVRVSPEPRRARAHVASGGEAEPHTAWLRRCVDLLQPRGRLLAIHRPEAVPSLLAGLSRRMGGLRLMPVYPRLGRPAVRILIGGIMGSRAPLTLLPGLMLHEPDGRFTAEAEAVHRGEDLPFWPADLGRRRRSDPDQTQRRVGVDRP